MDDRATTAPLHAEEVVRRFGAHAALDGVSLGVRPGEVHALLGPNGAGKTTLMRILMGLLAPTEGRVEVLGVPVGSPEFRFARSRIGLVPSGDRSFYLRISALENLAFFARLQGLRRRDALARATELLEHVGLAGVARAPKVGLFSHGMQKRLSVARALIAYPDVLLVDEATHDLDPEGARAVIELVRDAAERGAAVLWATQRLDEIRRFAENVTLLQKGRVRFQGSVPRLLEHSVPRHYVLQLRNGGKPTAEFEAALQHALGPLATIASSGTEDPENFLLELAEGSELGDALSALPRADARVIACRQETSDIEEAFLSLVRSPS
jgi:ABC-2 type transport system ATP-binding protein